MIVISKRGMLSLCTMTYTTKCELAVPFLCNGENDFFCLSQQLTVSYFWIQWVIKPYKLLFDKILYY